MKRKWKIAAAVVCALFLVTVAYAAVSGAGGQNDPLVTLSYLTNVFAPKVEDLAKKVVGERQEQNEIELNDAIDYWDEQVQQAIDEAGVSGSGGVTYHEVTLEAGEILVMREGCEVILRSGAVKWNGDTALMDMTAGSDLASGKALSANHLYMSTGDGALSVVGGQTTTTQPAKTTGTVTAGPLNVRSGPGGGIVGSVNKGDVVTILSTVDGWYQIAIGSLSGYVSADYVTVNEAEPAPSGAPAASVTLLVRGAYQIQ